MTGTYKHVGSDTVVHVIEEESGYVWTKNGDKRVPIPSQYFKRYFRRLDNE